MLCNDFVDAMNRLLDERSANRDELLNHTHECATCRRAWEAFQRCEEILAQRSQANSGLSDRVVQQAKQHSVVRWRKKAIAAAMLVTTTAAAVIVFSTAFIGDWNANAPSKEIANQARPQANNTWPHWYASTDLPSVDEIWSNWADESAQSAVTASMSASFRPVANTMSSAFQAIRQNMLRVPQPATGEVDEQARLTTEPCQFV